MILPFSRYARFGSVEGAAERHGIKHAPVHPYAHCGFYKTQYMFCSASRNGLPIRHYLAILNLSGGSTVKSDRAPVTGRWLSTHVGL